MTHPYLTYDDVWEIHFRFCALTIAFLVASVLLIVAPGPTKVREHALILLFSLYVLAPDLLYAPLAACTARAQSVAVFLGDAYGLTERTDSDAAWLALFFAGFLAARLLWAARDLAWYFAKGFAVGHLLLMALTALGLLLNHVFAALMLALQREGWLGE